MSEVRYCFICSAVRSGSTFCDLLLGGHSQTASLGEFSFMAQALALGEKCSCGSTVADCASWSKVFDRIQRERSIDLRATPYAMRQWDTKATVVIDREMQTPAYMCARKLRAAWMHFRFSQTSKVQRLLPLPTSLKAGIGNTFYLYDIVREEWGRKVVIDSSKNVHKALAMYQRNPDAVRIILQTRDGRGVYHSRRTSSFSRRDSLEGWRRYYQRALPLLQENVKPAHLIKLRYEDLTANTEQTLKQVCDLLSLPYEAGMLHYSAGTRHVVNGNTTRFSRDRGIRLDERWKTELVGDELAYFMRHGRDLNQSLGYEL